MKKITGALAIVYILTFIAAIPTSDAKTVKETDLPDYKNCRVWLKNTGELIAGHPNGVATHYECENDVFVLEFRNSQNERPFRIDMTKVLGRDVHGYSTRDIRWVYTLRGDEYEVLEYHTDWEEIRKLDK